MKTFTIDHYIQRDILRSLSQAEQLRFAALKPKGLESNLFMYHLRRLLQLGLVTKEGSAYHLTSEGLRHVARVSRTNLDPRILPNLISLLIVGNEYGEYAMHKRSAQPFMGYFTFPGGILRFDEDIPQHLEVQTQEKLGFQIPLTLRGTVSLRLGDEHGVLTHAYAQLFVGSVKGRPRITAKDSRFTPRWLDVAGHQKDILPDIPIILEKLAQDEPHFFADIVQTVSPKGQS